MVLHLGWGGMGAAVLGKLAERDLFLFEIGAGCKLIAHWDSQGSNYENVDFRQQLNSVPRHHRFQSN